jgi:hypothetical protein
VSGTLFPSMRRSGGSSASTSRKIASGVAAGSPMPSRSNLPSSLRRFVVGGDLRRPLQRRVAAELRGVGTWLDDAHLDTEVFDLARECFHQAFKGPFRGVVEADRRFRAEAPKHDTEMRTSTSTINAASNAMSLPTSVPSTSSTPATRRVPRAARHRQDPPRHRAVDPGVPSRPPRRLRHRRRVGRPARRRPRRRPAPRRAPTTRTVPAAGHRRGRLHPLRSRRWEPGFFQLVSARYERASVIVTSNKPFGRWGEVFGDPVVAAAMIDRLVHHAEVVSLKGDSYRLKDRDLGRVPTDDAA